MNDGNCQNSSCSEIRHEYDEIGHQYDEIGHEYDEIRHEYDEIFLIFSKN